MVPDNSVAAADGAEEPGGERLRRLEGAYAQLLETNRSLAREAFAKRGSAAAMALVGEEAQIAELKAALECVRSANESLEAQLAAPRHRLADRLNAGLVRHSVLRRPMTRLGGALRARAAPTADPARDRSSVPVERNAPYAPTPDDRPEPLEVSPLPLTRAGAAQMSFGERAALEGVLGEIKPGLALEIGTGEGGSLQRIASHSAEVHSIDIDHDPVRAAGPLPDHVTLHTGPSADVLSGLLQSFAPGRTLDFVLVDGDHSFEGVATDLRALLASPATRRTVILVHDSTNPEVRAGIRSVAFDAYDKVVLHEVDFLPGYTFAEGAVRGSVWGGLALVLTDVRRSEGYTETTRQTRYLSQP